MGFDEDEPVDTDGVSLEQKETAQRMMDMLHGVLNLLGGRSSRAGTVIALSFVLGETLHKVLSHGLKADVGVAVIFGNLAHGFETEVAHHKLNCRDPDCVVADESGPLLARLTQMARDAAKLADAVSPGEAESLN